MNVIWKGSMRPESSCWLVLDRIRDCCLADVIYNKPLLICDRRHNVRDQDREMMKEADLEKRFLKTSVKDWRTAHIHQEDAPPTILLISVSSSPGGETSGEGSGETSGEGSGGQNECIGLENGLHAIG
uniref:Uncharacterized protein n=1 Tax=Caenorhabditis tropicalis TaxID=1561998 RepID=A0A1I7UWU9_9PELO